MAAGCSCLSRSHQAAQGPCRAERRGRFTEVSRIPAPGPPAASAPLSGKRRCGSGSAQWAGCCPVPCDVPGDAGPLLPRRPSGPWSVRSADAPLTRGLRSLSTTVTVKVTCRLTSGDSPRASSSALRSGKDAAFLSGALQSSLSPSHHRVTLPQGTQNVSKPSNHENKQNPRPRSSCSWNSNAPLLDLQLRVREVPLHEPCGAAPKTGISNRHSILGLGGMW